jgi:hypothetical protein
VLDSKAIQVVLNPRGDSRLNINSDYRQKNQLRSKDQPQQKCKYKTTRLVGLSIFIL